MGQQEQTEYEEVAAQVLAIPRYKKKTDQNMIRKLLALLGAPQEQLKFIHVAGTNGKGSVCAFLKQIGRENGKRIGMFTSPHLLDMRERIRLNDEMISEQDFVACYHRVKEAEQKHKEQGGEPATFFEFVFCMACCYYETKHVDYVIVEAGMGGRTDSTNVITPEISVITSVGLDHMAILGDTIEKIAYEKAGIIKPGVPAVCGLLSDAAADVVCRYAKDVGAGCQILSKEDIRILKNTVLGIDFLIESEYDKEDLFHTSLCGGHQAYNAFLAMQAAKQLWKLPYDAMKDAVRKTEWPGRMEALSDRFYVDGAHNPQAMDAFVNTVEQLFPTQKKALLYTVASDKDDETMVRKLLRIRPQVIVCTELHNNRKTSVNEIMTLIEQQAEKENVPKPELFAYPKLNDALSYLFTLSKDTVILCVGSLYLVSEVKEYWNTRTNNQEAEHDQL